MPTPPLDYRNLSSAADATTRPNSSRTQLGWTIAAIAAIALLVAVLSPSLGRARESANRVKCSSNLKQIGQAVLLYHDENGGQLPPDFVALLATQDLVTDVFTCSSTKTERAEGPTQPAIFTEFLAGDHLDYAWLGTGLHGDLPADVVLAFDLERHQPKDSARGVGVNVLLGDGSVQFVDETTAKAIRAQYHAGVRPVRLPGAPRTSPK